MEIDFTKTTFLNSTFGLMIGNIIQYKKGHLAKIEELTDSGLISVVGLESNYINGRYDIKQWYGVPLSAEIFKSLGFHCDNFEKNNEYQNNFCLLYENSWQIMFTVNYYNETGTYSIDGFGKIEYLHELQNYVKLRFKKDLSFPQEIKEANN